MGTGELIFQIEKRGEMEGGRSGGELVSTTYKRHGRKGDNNQNAALSD